MSDNLLLTGRRYAYLHMVEYLTRVDSRIRTNDWDREGNYKAKRQVIANAIKWAEAQVQETYDHD